MHPTIALNLVTAHQDDIRRDLEAHARPGLRRWVRRSGPRHLPLVTRAAH